MIVATRGDSFALTIAVKATAGGAASDLTGWTVASQLRKPSRTNDRGALMDALTVTIADWELRAWSTQVYTATGAAVEGDRMTILPYVDGANVVPFVYTVSSTSNALFRAFDIGVSS